MEKKCAVWGTRAVGQWLAKELLRSGDHLCAFCSSSKTSQGKLIDSIPVVSPEKLKILCCEGKITHIVLGMGSVIHEREVREILKREFPREIHIITSDDIQNPYLLNMRDQIKYKWNIDFENQANIWIQNFKKEVEYWVHDVVAPNGKDHYTYEQWMNNTEFAGIETTSCRLAQTLEQDSIVLDLGSGLLSKYGTKLPDGSTVQLIPVDALAPFYNILNQKYAARETVRCSFGMFEFMAHFYPENYCDAILISNALDHCIDPYKSIIECLSILKNGGRMHLVHRRAEAVFEGYDGLHKWNIDYNKRNDLIIWNEENAVNVSENLRELANITVTHSEDFSPRREQMIIIEITKAKHFPLEKFIDIPKERYYLAFLIKGLMQWIADNTEFEKFLVRM